MTGAGQGIRVRRSDYGARSRLIFSCRFILVIPHLIWLEPSAGAAQGDWPQAPEAP